MKYALLYALSFALLSQSAVLAESSRSSAGAQTPVKLGGESRTQQLQERASRQTKAAPAESATTSSANKSDGAAKPAEKTSAKAGSKSLIPPPPDVTVSTGKSKKRAKRARPEDDTTQTTAKGPDNKLVTVGSGGPFKFSGRAKDQFAAEFNWQPDDRNDELTLTASFSPVDPASKAAHFNWIRFMLGNRMLASEQTLKNKTEMKVDLTGSVAPGSNQILIEGQGMGGATIEWKLTTPRKVKLTSINPDEVVVGQDLTLKGENFDPTTSKDVITLGPKNFNPNIASNQELKLRIPANFTPGEYPVKVTVDGLSSKELKVTVRGIPELSGTNLQGVPPGAQLVVYGKNFSKKLNENKVTIGGNSAEVVAGSTEQLTVVVPNFYTGMTNDTAGVAGQVGVPVKVKVGKIESKNSVPINVGNSTWADPGLQTGPGIQTVPVDWRRLLE